MVTRDKNGPLRKLLKKYEDEAARHLKAADVFDNHARILRATIESLEALETAK